MVVSHIIGNISNYPIDGKVIDPLELEWFERPKKIQRKQSNAGQEIAIKLLSEKQQLHQGDIVYEDDKKLIVVHIKLCEAIVLTPKTMLEMGTICYEIGNKHLPLFIEENQVMMPFEMPMFGWLEASGYAPQKQEVQLLNMLKSNVMPHIHAPEGSSLFNKILNINSSKL